ncbi:MAG: hypothetical protein K2Q22_02205 [Cytophagales bacterium]|nr:hypothetical protein [Cytophagales bacterium]
MRFLLLANFLFEAAIGAIMIYNPSLILPVDNELVVSLARSFGFVACILAVFSGLIIRHEENKELLSVGLLVFLLFHSGLAFLQYLNFQAGLAPIQVVVIHGIFAGGFLYYFSRN